MDLDEARAILGQYRNEDPDDTPIRTVLFMEYDDSNDDADRLSSAIYGETVIDRAKEVGVVWTACDELAASLGSIGDEDEARWGLLAIANQWRHAATAFGIPTPEAVSLGILAEELRHEIDRLDDGLCEVVPDLVAISRCHWDLENLAAGWAMSSPEVQDEYLQNRLQDVQTAFGLMAVLKADLRGRGELGLDDYLFPED